MNIKFLESRKIEKGFGAGVWVWGFEKICLVCNTPLTRIRDMER